ncbi:MAG: peptide-methionine (S)-S-oxide reductase MsrA [Hyphomicrobiales bacterium]|nr:peptide-methionine (S)-S-oxide reductase MsrA [Hyphomicrobiales bacterium]
MAIAIFAAGCFWGVEATFRKLSGVEETEVGYIGGTTEAPTYKDVCSGRTGHAEAVRLSYDPERISYDELLGAFWGCHDPTTRDRQGPDIGSQYRSVIFFTEPGQQASAVKSKQAQEESGRFSRPIVTTIETAPRFWRAEEYHQQYIEKRNAG